MFFVPLCCPLVLIAFLFVRARPAEVDKREAKVVNELRGADEAEAHTKSHQT